MFDKASALFDRKKLNSCCILTNKNWPYEWDEFVVDTDPEETQPKLPNQVTF